MKTASQRVSVIFVVTMLGIGVALGLWIPARLGMTTWFIASVFYRLRRDPQIERAPWAMMAGGALVSMLGAIGRAIHSSAIGVDYAFPSPADLLTVAGYLLLIAAIFRFSALRSATSDAQASKDTLLDAVILAAASWVVMFAGVLSGYLQDDLIPLDERLLNGLYATMTVVLFAATARLAIGPGIRNISLILLGLAGLAITANDVMVLSEVNTSSSSVVAVLAMGCAAGSVLHPGAERITKSISTVETNLSRERITLLGVALLVVPLTLVAGLVRGVVPDMGLLIAGTTLLSVSFLYRLARLFRSNEQLTSDLAHESADEKYRLLTEGSADVIMVIDPDDQFTFITENAWGVLDRPNGDFLGQGISAVFDTDSSIRLAEMVTAARRSGGRFNDEVLIRSNGNGRWFGVDIRDYSEVDDIAGLVINIRDIHDRRQSEQRVLRSEARFRSLVQHSSDIVAIIDADEFLTYVSPAIEPILGYKPSELLGSNILDILAIDAVREASDIRDRLVAGESVDRESLDLRTAAKDGSWRYLNVTVTDMLSDPAVAGIVLNVRDDTERLSLERNLRFQANHDSLTSLANRPQLVDALGDVLADGTRQTEMIGVMFIDLDDFKMINDALGHSVGDQVLVEVSNRLATTVRINDVLARFGADEFAVLMTGIYGEHEMLDLAERVLASISKSLPVDGRAINLSASIGIAYDINRSISADELVKQADVAMYSAKDRGKAQVAVFDEQMLSEAGGRLDLIESLRQGIENHELEVHYQPLVNLQTEHIVGFEALVRWNHPERGLIGPAAFIDVAEDTGLINPLGMLVLDDASRQLAEWIENGHDLYMSVNVSAVQLQLDTIVEDLTGCVAAAGLDHGRIVLEITESVFVRDKDLIADRLQKLRANGFRIAIDDFGTGYSSLQYLQQFEFDILKIDKSFVDRLETGDDGGVIETVIGLAAKSNATTVAEGIESAGQARALRELSCELGQGYYYARPMPAAETANALASEPLPLDSTNAEVAQRAA